MNFCLRVISDMDADASFTLGSRPTDDEVNAVWNSLVHMSNEQRRKTLVSLTKPDRTATVQGSNSDVRRVPVGIDQRTLTHSPVQVETTQFIIKNFSGQKPGPGEVDYKHWRRSALQIASDESISESRARTYILQSLTGAADDAIDLHRDEPVKNIIAILDKIFGTIADGTDLLAEFFQRFQQPGEQTSQYVNTLYIALCEVVKQDGIPMRDVPETLVRQILRGCSDEQMLNKLRLDERLLNKPRLEEQDPVPEYPDLIVRIRREEARRTERRLRLKQAARRNTALLDSSMESQSPQTPPKRTPETPQTTELDDKLKQLRQKVAQLEASHTCTDIFCYRCGDDGHMAYDCQGLPNRALVEEKKVKRQQSRNGKRSGNAKPARSAGQRQRQGSNPRPELDDLVGGTPEI